MVETAGMSLMEEFEMGPIRPPSEGGSNSLLLRFSRNCSWNNCTFCYGLHYGREKLQLRSVEEIKQDIDRAKVMAEVITETSEKLGAHGKVNNEVADALFSTYPSARYSPGFTTVLNWLYVGGHTVFLQDADTLIMRTPDLVEAITYLKKTFPAINRITSYARSKTALKKSSDELKLLKEAGLSRLHIGLETGDDALLKRVRKGVTADEHIRAGRKIVKAGIELSEYIMPGLGGRELTKQHAVNTATVLNEINPDFIRSRPLAPRQGTPIAEAYHRGELALLSPHGLIKEIQILVRALTVSSRLCFDHALNPCMRSEFGYVPLFDQSYEGYKMPDEKEQLLAIVEKGLKTDESEFVGIEEIAKMSL